MEAGGHIHRRGVMCVGRCAGSQSVGGLCPDGARSMDRADEGPAAGSKSNPATVRAMPRGVMPPHGAVVSVDVQRRRLKVPSSRRAGIPPPSWFATAPPPRLPVVMMIGAEINTPADWIRAGAAASTADAFAAAHAGFAPVLVFADSGGAFGIDTECVNGSRGNADDHLTRDIIPYVVSTFDVSPIRANWGVAGFSTGGTCAVGLAVRHPNCSGLSSTSPATSDPTSARRRKPSPACMVATPPPGPSSIQAPSSRKTFTTACRAGSQSPTAATRPQTSTGRIWRHSRCARWAALMASTAACIPSLVDMTGSSPRRLSPQRYLGLPPHSGRRATPAPMDPHVRRR